MPPRTRAGRAGDARRYASDRALVLRRFPYGESSLVVHALTPEHGRVPILAKGAYRPKSGYFGVLDLHDTLRLSWRRTPRSELALLVAGEVTTRRRGPSRDLDRYRASLAILELAALGAREGHEERLLFEGVEQALDRLDAGDTDPALVCAAFDLAFLELQGLAPALGRCATCGRKLTDPPGASAQVDFSDRLGGRLCTACAAEARSRGTRIEARPLHTLRLARSLLDAPFPLLARIRLDPDRTDRLCAFVRRFLEVHLETRPRVAGPRSRPAPRRTARTGGAQPSR